MARPPVRRPAAVVAEEMPDEEMAVGAMAGGAMAGEEMMADEEMAAEEDTAAGPVLFTVMGPPEGPFVLMAGDEPEGEGEMAADAPTFDSPASLMRAIMELLSSSAGAEDSFAAGFRGEPDPMAAGPAVRPPPV